MHQIYHLELNTMTVLLLFLAMFTYTTHSQVQMYAAANLSSERGYLGYVIRGCGTSPFKRETFATLPDNDSHLETIVQTMVCFYIVGTTLLIILILLGSGLFLHKCKKESIMDNGDSTAECSHDNYGLLWGLVTMSLLGNVLLTAHGIYIVYLHLTSGVFKLIAAGWMMLGQMVFEIIASLTVGIYYGRKLNFMVPSIFLLPVTFICCCHAKETSKKIVQCLSIWSLLMFILHVCYRASFLFLALLARPPVVISTALLIIFAAFYFVHLLAILFTFTKVRKRQQRKRYVYSLLIDLVQTVAVMVVFATAICFGSVIGFVGMLANYGTIMNNPYSMLSTLITPLALAGFGWALRKVGAEWLRSVTSPNTAEQDEIVPLLQEPKQRVSVNPKAGGDQMRKSTLMSCLMQWLQNGITLAGPYRFSFIIVTGCKTSKLIIPLYCNHIAMHASVWY